MWSWVDCDLDSGFFIIIERKILAEECNTFSANILATMLRKGSEIGLCVFLNITLFGVEASFTEWFNVLWLFSLKLLSFMIPDLTISQSFTPKWAFSHYPLTSMSVEGGCIAWKAFGVCEVNGFAAQLNTTDKIKGRFFKQTNKRKEKHASLLLSWCLSKCLNFTHPLTQVMKR